MTTKTFDAVRLMRELRDGLSHDMEHMTPEERIRYISDKVASTDLSRGFMHKEKESAQQGAPADGKTAARFRRG